VCPLFFRLGQPDALARGCAAANIEVIAQHRIPTTLIYADAVEPCDAAFVGGPVALAWSRFSDEIRARVRALPGVDRSLAQRPGLSDSCRVRRHRGPSAS
jgi:hypothetical protein